METLKLKDLKAKNYLFQAIDWSTFWLINLRDNFLQRHIQTYLGCHEEKVSRDQEGKECMQLQILQNEFENLHMKSGESIINYLSRTMTVTNKMWIHDKNIEDVTIIKNILLLTILKFNFFCLFYKGI